MKKIMLGAALLLSFNSLNAQEFEFSHSAGLTYLIGIYSFEEVTPEISYSYSGATGYPGLTYNPRLDLKLDRELSLSLTAYPTLCFSGSAEANSRTGVSSSSSFAFEIPAGVQLNFGNHATQKSRKDFGGFVMAGYNWGSYSGIGKVSSITAQAGLKFYIAEKPLGLRFEYNLPFGLDKTYKEKLQLFGVGVLWNFEM